MMGSNYLSDFGNGMMSGAGILLLVVGLATVIALAALLARRVPRTISARRDQCRMALELLDERYARGEIDAREYKARLTDLTR
ncbi:MAG: SHOCT domain-containing protein [Bordetella sp.]|uniref:SHOCT domain-containing protein n=1 Tax=Bordetella sp. TaxID=28081 RepID=UPI003F7C0DCA